MVAVRQLWEWQARNGQRSIGWKLTSVIDDMASLYFNLILFMIVPAFWSC